MRLTNNSRQAHSKERVLNSLSFNRIVAWAILVPILAVSLTGCTTKKKTATSEAEVTLTIWRAADNQEAFAEIIKEYQSDNPNVKINVVYDEKWKDDPELYRQASIDALSTGKGPDIWSVRNDWMAYDHNKLRPAPDGALAAYAAKDYANETNSTIVQKTLVPVVAKDGLYNCENKTLVQALDINSIASTDLSKCEVYGLPMSVDTLGLYINQSIIEQALTALSQTNKVTQSLSPETLTKLKKILTNGPSTWTDLVDVAPYITVMSGNAISTSEVAMGTGSNIEQAPGIIASILMQSGAEIIKSDLSAATFDLPKSGSVGDEYPGVSAMQFYSNFARPLKINSSDANPLYTWNNSFSSAKDAFATNKLAMIFEDSRFASELVYRKSTVKTTIKPMPQLNANEPKVYGSYWFETVTNNSKNSAYAWDFLSYAAIKNAKAYLSNTKRTSALLGQYNEKAEGTDVFVSQANKADSWYKGRDPNGVDSIVRQWADNVISGPNTSDTLTTETRSAAAQITTILQSSQQIVESTATSSSSTSSTTSQ